MPVTLVLDELRMRAKVEPRGDASLDLVVPATPARVRRPGGADVLIEFVSEQGPCRLLGTATVALSDASDEPRVRFTPAGPVRLLLRSERVRATVEMEIEVDAGLGAVKRRTRDLRGGGALVSGPLDLEADAEVRYLLRLPARIAPVEGAGRVARVTAEGDVAIQFVDLGDEDRDDILLAAFEARRSRDA
jgi:hypothetical protein